MAAKLNTSSNTVPNARCHGLLSGDVFFELRPMFILLCFSRALRLTLS
jgi:hypothetical protein